MNRHRRSRAELRELLLDAGRKILSEEGLETGSTNITFKRVFARVESETGERVTNASVIRRIWENQAAYQTDVLMEVARDDSRNEAGAAIDSITAELGSLDLTTPEGRASALRQLCRIGGNASSFAIADSDTWQLWISAMAFAVGTSSAEQREKVRLAISIGYDTVTEFWSEQFALLIDLLGLRFRSPFTLHDLVLAVIAYSEGCSLRQKSTGLIDQVARPTGPNGEDQNWTLFAIGLEGLAHQYLEPTPVEAG